MYGMYTLAYYDQRTCKEAHFLEHRGPVPMCPNSKQYIKCKARYVPCG